MIPRWAVKSIRQQASWVGKRYYPHKEDLEQAEEIKALRSIAPDDPERTVEPYKEEGLYDVKQPTRGGGFTSVGPIKAASAEEALKKGKLSLPYRPRKGHVGLCLDCKKDKAIGPSPLLDDGSVVCYQCIMKERTRTIAKMDGVLAQVRHTAKNCAVLGTKVKCPILAVLPSEVP